MDSKTSTPLDRMYEALKIGRWDKWVRIFTHNLVTAAALCRAYRLGGEACTCDRGPSGHEWYPGCDTSPEAIVDRHWNDDSHCFNPGEVKAPPYGGLNGFVLCTDCGMPEGDWRHES